MKKIISLLLSVLFLTSALFSINVFAEGSDYNSMLDFRDGNYLAMSKKMTFAEIAAQIGNKTCTASELVFLNNKYGEFEMEYGYAIPSGHVNVIKVSENEIRVEAQSYSYTAENGKNVTWIPVNASYRQGVTKLNEEDGRYVGTIKNIEFDQKFYATVRYIAEIQIPYEIYSVIVNEAFRVGFETSAIISAYDFEMGIYNNQLKNYNQYLKDMEEYDLAMTKYLEDSGIYSKWVIDKAEYDEYLLKKAAFDYNELLKTNYAEMYAEWQQYSISKSLCENFLTTMDTVFEKKPDLGNGVDGVSMAHMITGTGLKIVYDRVNSVGESTLKLMFGNAAKEFSNCEARLVVLTDLLNTYNTLSTREKMFNWYKTNYAVYKENIHSLYNSMNIILNNKSFSWAMEAANLTPEQQVKIKRFVFYLGAYDTALVNPNDPTDYKWPAFVAEPGKPDYSMIEPYPVADPGVVEEPIAPEKPKDVNPPSKKPEDLVLSDIEKALAEDVDKERLTEKVIVKDYVTIINDVVAQVSNESSAITLLFMDYDGSVLTRAELDSDFDPSSIFFF
ncbi:MAG: hypothetical protein MJ236_06270, partial [Clostridia bacterium]|nr:hypothetical protein [Clostridia bacterium]